MDAAAADRRWMRRALDLAERGRETTRPNPLVGCVVVAAGRVVAERWHERAGGPHAEAAALAAAGDRARGATAYVSLEPCAHHGRTPPCASALIEAGVSRVVYAAADPHPHARGGAGVLRAAGVEVVAGVLADRAEEQNEVFLTAVRHGRPHVTLKVALTADGATTVPGRRWITGDAARAEVHRLRADADAVVVGSGTALTDDPRLTVRHRPVERQPRPVVLDGRGRLPLRARVVRPGAVVVTAAGSASGWRRELTRRGVDVVEVAAAAGGVDLPAALTALCDRGVQAVLAEPGATLAAALLDGSLVDRLVVHTAPHGSADRAGAWQRRVKGAGVLRLPPPGWLLRRRRPLGDDVEEVYAPPPATSADGAAGPMDTRASDIPAGMHAATGGA